MSFFLALGVFLGIAIILAVSINLVMGYGGLVTIAHGAMMGVGGYTASVVAIRWGINFVWAILLGAVASAVIGYVFMLATARLTADEFILASFAFQMVVIEAIGRWTSVTNGTRGLSGIPRPAIFGTQLGTLQQYAVFVYVVTAVVVLIFLLYGRSPYGLALRGLRESEPSMQAIGKDPTHLKTTAFAVGAAGAAIAGALFASMVRFIHPDNFGIRVSIIAIAYLLVGGLGNMYGAVLGAAFLIAIPEIIRALEIVPTHLIGPVQQIIYGLVLMLFVWFRPQGILPERPIIKVGRRQRRGSAYSPDPEAVA